MFFLDKFIESSLDTPSGVLTITPACEHIRRNFLLFLLVSPDIKRSNFFLHQHTLIQNYCTVGLGLFFLKYLPTCELFLPEIEIVREDLDCVFEEIVVDGVTVTFFEGGLKLLNFFFKIFGSFKLKVQLSPHPYLIDLLVILRMCFPGLPQLPRIFMHKITIDPTYKTTYLISSR